MYEPKFQYTDEIVRELISIERLRTIVEMSPLTLEAEKELRYTSKIKAAHYSTRIEGNPLDLSEASEAIISRKDREGSKAEQEVRNYWDVLSFLSASKKMKIQITEKFIRRLHSIIEVRSSGRRHKESQYRGPMPPGVLFAVYDNETRKPEYIPPEAKDVPFLMKDLTEWINSLKSSKLPVPIKAAISVYQLLTIHPFEDGNGRTARALATYILSINGYDLKGFNSMEEYYFADLKGYYKNIQMGLPVVYYEGRNCPNDLGPWIYYFLNIMNKASGRVINQIKIYNEREINPKIKFLEPKEKKLIRLLLMKSGKITPMEIAEEFNVKSRTITKWAVQWLEKGIITPGSGEKRIRSYKIGAKYEDITLKDLGYLEQNG